MRRLSARSTAARMAVPIVVTVMQACATLAGAALVHRAGHEPVEALPITLAVAALLCAFVLEVLRRRICEAIGWHDVALVRASLLRRILQADPTVVARQRHGALLQVFVGDLSARRQWWSDGLPRAMTAPVLLLALLAWAGWQSPSLAALILGLLVAGSIAGAALLRPMSRAVSDVRRARGQLSAFASDRIERAATGAATPRRRAELRRLGRRSDALNRAALHRAWLVGALRGLPHLVTSLILMAVLVGGGQISGTIVVIGTAGLALADLSRAAELWIPARISARRIARLMRLPRSSRARPVGAGTVPARGMLVDLADRRIKADRP